MKALSLWQPWASLIACGLKRVETRSWATSYRGPVLIHAAKRWTADELDALARLRAEHPRVADELPDVRELPLGAVVAVARIAECHQMTYDWIEDQTDLERDVGGWEADRFGWVLEGVRALPAPVPCVGAQGLWSVRRVQASGVAAYPKRLARELPEADYDRLRAIYDEVARG